MEWYLATASETGLVSVYSRKDLEELRGGNSVDPSPEGGDIITGCVMMILQSVGRQMISAPLFWMVAKGLMIWVEILWMRCISSLRGRERLGSKLVARRWVIVISL